MQQKDERMRSHVLHVTNKKNLKNSVASSYNKWLSETHWLAKQSLAKSNERDIVTGGGWKYEKVAFIYSLEKYNKMSLIYLTFWDV